MTFVFYLCFMKKLIFTLSSVFFAGVAMAQIGTTFHIVMKGETLTQIAKKYNTTTSNLLLLNPEAAHGLKENQKLNLVSSATVSQVHEVGPKETLYSISKKYQMSVDQILALNPDIKNNALQVGQLLIIKSGSLGTKTQPISTAPSTPSAATTAPKGTLRITVEPGETIYGIAVKNGTTVSQIYELNPEIVNSGIRSGQELLIPSTKTPEVVKLDGTPVKTTSKTSVKTIIVQPKETLYNITKTYNVSTEQLMSWNPELKEGLKTGMELVVGQPSLKSFELVKDASSKTELSENKREPLRGLQKAKAQRELVLLLPFNMDQINLNDKAAINQKFNSDVFLNMTVDFYSGVMMALDSLKAKNYPLQVKIVDSKESNRAMNVKALKSQFDFSNTDVIIGPFFQKNVDAISEAFKGTETLVFSPLSTEKGQPSANQVHTMPNGGFLANAMLQYVASKNQNTVVVMHPKSERKSLFSGTYPQMKVVTTDAKGAIKAEAIAAQLSKTSKNYVILDSNALETAIGLVNALASLQKTYSIQMVSLDKNDNLDSSEIAMSSLTQLGLLFPSVTNEVSHWQADQFANKYRQKYGVNPNRFATRGFDVTYDIITRMFQSEDRAQNIFSPLTEQVENKFEYVSENGGIYNQAVYILQYDTDLTIKAAK